MDAELDLNTYNMMRMVKYGFVIFQYYRNGNLWYSCSWKNEPDEKFQTRFLFPVPIEDIGNATFNRTDKPILFMRYMRKHIKTLKEQNNGQ